MRSDSTRRASARCSISLARSWAARARCSASLTSFWVCATCAACRSDSSRSAFSRRSASWRLEGLQVLVALVARVGEQLGRLGPLLLGLPGGLGPLLGDLPLGGGPQGGDLTLDGGLQLGHLVRGDRTQLLGLPLGVRPQGVRLAAGLDPDLRGLPLGGGADAAGLPLGGGLHRGRLGARLVGDLAGLEAGGGEDALRLALGLVAVVVGLLLGQPEDLLDAGAEAGEGRPAVLLELLVGVGELLLQGALALLGLPEPALGVVHPLLGLGAGLLGLGQRGGQPTDEVIDLTGVVSAQANGEIGLRVRVIEERERGGLLLGHWDILADHPGSFARAVPSFRVLITWSTPVAGGDRTKRRSWQLPGGSGVTEGEREKGRGTRPRGPLSAVTRMVCRVVERQWPHRRNGHPDLTRTGQWPRNRLIAVSCRARSAVSRTPRPSAGARHRTPTLPWCALRCTSYAAWPVCSNG